MPLPTRPQRYCDPASLVTVSDKKLVACGCCLTYNLDDVAKLHSRSIAISAVALFIIAFYVITLCFVLSIGLLLGWPYFCGVWPLCFCPDALVT